MSEINLSQVDNDKFSVNIELSYRCFKASLNLAQQLVKVAASNDDLIQVHKLKEAEALFNLGTCYTIKSRWDSDFE